VPGAEGAYVMRLTAGAPGEVPQGEEPQAVALTTGWVMGYSPEYAALEADPAYLAHLVELGGGQVLEQPADAFARTLRGEGTTRDLWPYLLGLAALLLPFDVGVRRLVLGRRDLARARAWLMARLPRRRPHPAVESPSPLGRLFEAKSRAEERRPVDGVGVSAEDGRPVDETRVPAGPEVSPRPAERPPARREGTGVEADRGAAEGDTLAGRLLRKKREREEDS
jgi:hypothetical protein